MFAEGTQINDRVVLREQLANGAFGVLWRGRQSSLECDVAVKLLTELDDEARSRFDAEAKVIAKLSSPHIVKVFDYGKHRGVPYMVMELLTGETLGERIDRTGALPLKLVQGIITQAARALDHAHGRGVVHRDVKPDNIHLCEGDDGKLLVKLLDFGIAKTAWATAGERLTREGVMMGSPAYMSPEQIICSKSATTTCDVWSLAVVAFEALTGLPPFLGEEDEIPATVSAILARRWVSPTHHEQQLDDSVMEVFEQAFALEPAARFQSATAFARALAGCRDEAVVALVDEPIVIPGVAPRRRWLLAVMALATGAIVGVALLSRPSLPFGARAGSGAKVAVPASGQVAPAAAASSAALAVNAAAVAPISPRRSPGADFALPTAEPPAPSSSASSSAPEPETNLPVRKDYGF